jgi:hypothetical protein
MTTSRLIVLGFLFFLFAVFPNIKFASLQYTVENVLFFGWVGKQEFDKYMTTFIDKDNQNGEELDRELLWQVWGKSRWLNNSPYAEPRAGGRVRKVAKAERSALR